MKYSNIRLGKSFFCSFIFTCFLFIFASLSFAQNSWQEVQKAQKGEITVFYTNVVPFIYQSEDKNGSLKGIEYDLFSSFLDFVKQTYGYNIHCHYIYVERFHKLQDKIQEKLLGTFALAAFSITSQRKNDIQFSPPYIPDIEIMVSSHNLPLVEDTIAFYEHFQRTTALTIEHSTYHQRLKEIYDFYPNFRIQFADNHNQSYNRITLEDSLFNFMNLADYLYRRKHHMLLKRQPIFKIEREGLAIAMPKNSDWSEPLNRFFESKHIDSIKTKILRQYLGKHTPELVNQLAHFEGENEELALLKEENAIKEQTAIIHKKESSERGRLNNILIGIGMIMIVFLLISHLGFSSQLSKRKLLQQKNDQIESQKAKLFEKNMALQQRQQLLQEKNQEIEAKNKAIQEQNKRITDSIRAAQVIQNALLPFRSVMSKLFKEYFLLYLPRDIVSGDFFWMTQVPHKTFVAVIDCTGHGVPGAFMSMIGQAYLNKIVNEHGIHDTATILEEFHRNIRTSLKQDQIKEHTAYGMDVCIVGYEYLKNNRVAVQFSGAKRPLIYIHQGKLHQLRGTRKSIGGRPRKKNVKFTTHHITLLPSDILYLTTDGYVDSGNICQQNFGTQRFANILEQNYHKSLVEQREIIHQALLTHQTGTEQRDDITVLGVKV